MTKLLKSLEKENRNVSEETFRTALYMEEEYVKQLIHHTMPNLDIYLVEKVNNNYLEGFYLLTKDEYNVRYGGVEEKQLLHVTSQLSIENITKNNLDWRKTVRGNFGRGTYFSYDAKLANSICNPKVGNKRAIVVCKVLVSRTFSSCFDTLVPPSRDLDTATAYNGKVLIKFGDNEFLPIFVAYYDYDLSKLK